MLLVLLAGADTTGTVFQALVHFLLTHPGAYRRMMEEIDAAMAQGLISAVPQYDEIIEHLPYYVACVRETLRLNPPAPNIFPRYVSEPGRDLYGKFAPAGTEISGNPWIMQRDKQIYGRMGRISSRSVGSTLKKPGCITSIASHLAMGPECVWGGILR